MKFLIGAALLVFGQAIAGPVLSTEPKHEELTERSPLFVAAKLYTGCLLGTYQGVREIEPTRVGINAFVESLDNRCLMWMFVWYPALMDGEELLLEISNIQRFNVIRLQSLQSLTNVLRSQALIR